MLTKFISTGLRLVLLLICFTTAPAYAEVSLPRLISDGMVLQRDTELTIWGYAHKGERVTVSFRGSNYTALTDKDGRWSVKMKPQKPGGPYAMQIRGKNRIELTNILVGDVWLCSGQSNMEHYLGRHSIRYADEIAAANNTRIRQIKIPNNPVFIQPAYDVPEGVWLPATADHILDFSVVAYFFAKHLQEQYDVPIGIINSSVGGSPIEAWISEEGLKEFPDFIATLNENKDTAYVYGTNRRADSINRERAKTLPEDQGLAGDKKWYEPAYTPKNWSRINVPGYWEDQGVRDLNGVVWYRREIEIPADMAEKPALIEMGRIVDADGMYVNGEKIGSTGYQYPQRRYHVPSGLLKAGKNTLAIRVVNNWGKGGFVPDKPYYLATAGDTLDLKGYWHYKVGAAYPVPPPPPKSIAMRNQPGSFYNGMIAPLTNFAIKGAVWYQGESNAGRPEQYGELLPALINDWRRQWEMPDMPFLYAQLPNFMEVNYLPAESSWARLRESQLRALALPHTGMAVTIDLGEWNDIHPGNKKPVGDRLALAARHVAYGEDDITYSGPLFRSAEVQGNKVVLSFDHAVSGLVSRDGEPLRWFAIAGEDKKFEWARAEIRGDKVVVWSDGIDEPQYLRYAWSDNPDKVNFYNSEGLPASPFRTGKIE
ncbi:sialate O-acetylesterase [Roseivirga sp. BDSF3-8]|uniref:sialate O-acetylesterase n=1 Tax=Roseivirga sp. BDSF3-8 TaxID=3241598 RepID=UPI0035326DF3